MDDHYENEPDEPQEIDPDIAYDIYRERDWELT